MDKIQAMSLPPWKEFFRTLSASCGVVKPEQGEEGVVAPVFCVHQEGFQKEMKLPHSLRLTRQAYYRPLLRRLNGAGIKLHAKRRRQLRRAFHISIYRKYGRNISTAWFLYGMDGETLRSVMLERQSHPSFFEEICKESPWKGGVLIVPFPSTPHQGHTDE